MDGSDVFSKDRDGEEDTKVELYGSKEIFSNSRDEGVVVIVLVFMSFHSLLFIVV